VLPIAPDLHIGLPDRSVDLVTSRHEEFAAPEVFRVTNSGGWFITQQVGSRNNTELREELGAPTAQFTNNVASATGLAEQIAAAGFTIRDKAESTYSNEFLDVGAVVF
jgi:hypothetical protein